MFFFYFSKRCFGVSLGWLACRGVRVRAVLWRSFVFAFCALGFSC